MSNAGGNEVNPDTYATPSDIPLLQIVPISYSVTEKDQITGYNTGVVTGSMERGYVITNTIAQTSISVPVAKVWQDLGRCDETG